MVQHKPPLPGKWGGLCWNGLVNLLSNMKLKREERMESDLQEATYSEEGFCERNKSILPPVEELLLSRKLRREAHRYWEAGTSWFSN